MKPSNRQVAHTAASSALLNASFFVKPTNFCVGWPPLNKMTVGIALMPYLKAVWRLLSVSTLPNFA